MRSEIATFEDVPEPWLPRGDNAAVTETGVNEKSYCDLLCIPFSLEYLILVWGVYLELDVRGPGVHSLGV